MRLVEVRGFLAGQGWFDLHEARVAPPFGYDPHWSRLIDAGLAGLFLVFRQFSDFALAERLMRTAWPLLWLLPTMAGTLGVAWRLGGRDAALVTLVLTLLGLPATQQFTPGHIDHHSVQIALSVLTLAATVWSDRSRWCAAAAGAATGLAMSIGFECLPFLAVCGLAIGVHYALNRAAATSFAIYGISLAAGVVAAFLITVGPAGWTRTACDAIALNSAVPVVGAGILMAIAGSIGSDSPVMRIVVATAIGGAAVIAAVWLEPRCLGGPYATMDSGRLADLARKCPGDAAIGRART